MLHVGNFLWFELMRGLGGVGVPQLESVTSRVLELKLNHDIGRARPPGRQRDLHGAAKPSQYGALASWWL